MLYHHHVHYHGCTQVVQNNNYFYGCNAGGERGMMGGRCGNGGINCTGGNACLHNHGGSSGGSSGGQVVML